MPLHGVMSSVWCNTGEPGFCSVGGALVRAEGAHVCAGDIQCDSLPGAVAAYAGYTFVPICFSLLARLALGEQPLGRCFCQNPLA